MKRIAIMQPYFFPYIGYWQLMQTVDRFIIYDDVHYIKGGWINRNRILINGEPTYITVPLQQSSPNKRICDIALQASRSWRNKLVRSVEHTYRKAPFFTEIFPVIDKLIRYETDSLSEYLAHQLKTLAAFMGIKAEIVATSRHYQNDDLSGQARILDICQRERATTYINLKGGQTLYDRESFWNAGVDLRFIIMRTIPYKQKTSDFVSHLAIIDALMAVGPIDIREYLESFDLIETPSCSEKQRTS